MVLILYRIRQRYIKHLKKAKKSLFKYLIFLENFNLKSLIYFLNFFKMDCSIACNFYCASINNVVHFYPKRSFNQKLEAVETSYKAVASYEAVLQTFFSGKSNLKKHNP